MGKAGNSCTTGRIMLGLHTVTTLLLGLIINLKINFLRLLRECRFCQLFVIASEAWRSSSSLLFFLDCHVAGMLPAKTWGIERALILSRLGRLCASVLFILVFSIIGVSLSLPAEAQYLYEECYTAADIGDKKQERFIIRPIGEICFSRCESECNAFSRKSGGIELNQEVIDRCNVKCRAGELFSSRVKEPNPNDASPESYIESTDIFKTGTACSPGNASIASAGYNEYNTKLLVKPTQEAYTDEKTGRYYPSVGTRIKIINPGSNSSNSIYMCGATTQTITPQIASLRNKVWNSNASKINKLSWGARNGSYYDTGIDIKDGDYLSIIYGGQYRSCPDGKCTPIPLDKGLFIKRPSQPLDAQVSEGTALILPGKDFIPIPYTSNGNLPIDEGGVTYPENIESLLKENAEVKFLGLDGRSWQQNSRLDEGINFKDKESVFNGDTTVFSKDTYYSFTGVLKGFSPRFASLAIAHPDSKNNWSQHLGGYNVTISRKGCMFFNGERLQYAIAKKNDTPGDERNPTFSGVGQWYDVTEQNISSYENLNIPYEGILYLRIKPLPYESSATPDCSALEGDSCRDSVARTASLYRPENTGGEYYVLVERDDESSASTFITQIIDKLRGYLFGSKNSTLGDGAESSISGEGKDSGIVQHLFNRFVADSMFVSTIRVLLLFYIVYTGLTFIMGIAQLTQKEASVRLIKISIILMLIAPNSWVFFNTYLFRLFTDGALELLVLITAKADSSTSQIQALLKHPTDIFSEFNQPFKILFGQVTWAKILSILFSGPIGPMLCIIICVAAVIYIICIAKATLLYMISLIGIATLLLMAPIFISFVLFQYTKQMFDTWIKQLMSFAFQPIIVYTFIMVINYLILASLQVMLSFTACKTCCLSLPILDICLIPGCYTAIFSMHSPSEGIGMPVSLIVSTFYFLILALAMYAFTDFGARLANLIIMSSFAGIDLTGSVAKTISNSKTIVATILGTDRAGIEGSKRLRRRVDDAAHAKDRIVAGVKRFLYGRDGGG
ncbi:MAG: type IV secretion system protein [Candidatus Jidaibacter sp.]|jgi:type IV secretion system protein VirB6|nr:type IV secretion system protein [Candidatus Jidaibacter sp.]